MGKARRNKQKARKGHRIGKFPQVEVKNSDNGSMDLVLPDVSAEDLPQVSIITITKDRSLFAGVMLYNWRNIQYPRDKLEWIIVDDSQDPGENLEQYLPEADTDDAVIHYHRLKEWLPVADKRNKAVELANYEYIVHMDDDDYYFSDSVLAKIRIMLHYRCMGVHSIPVGVYDMMERSSYIFELENRSNDVAEATLAYKKAYWRKNKFRSHMENGIGEGRAFIGKNFNVWYQVHFLFNMISVTHAKNVTGHNRRFINEMDTEVQTGDFRQIFPQSFTDLLENIRSILVESGQYVQPLIEEDADGNLVQVK